MTKEKKKITKKNLMTAEKDDNDKMVVYDNRFNRLTLHVLNRIELNILSFFLHALKEKGDNEVIVSIADIKKYARIKDRSSGALLDSYIDDEGNTHLGILESLNKKILGMKIPVEFEKEGIKFEGQFNLFSAYAVSKDRKNFYLKIDSDYKFLINNITKYFTQYKLDDFARLNSSYSQLLFQILKQWDSVGKLEMTMDKFKEKLGIPSTYRMSAVNSRVLVPIEKELPKYLENFKIEKIKTGKTITSIKFTWDRKEQSIYEEGDIEDANIIEAEVIYSDDLKKAISKCKRNHFISDTKILTQENIEILLKEFSEVDVIEGLNKIYSAAKQPITELNYFKKVIAGIKTGTKKTERKNNANRKKTTVKEKKVVEEKIESEKVKEISEEEYKKLFEKEYTKYTKENKIQKSKLVRFSFEKMFSSQYKIIKKDEKFEEFLKNNYEKLKDKSKEEQLKIYEKFMNLF